MVMASFDVSSGHGRISVGIIVHVIAQRASTNVGHCGSDGSDPDPDDEPDAARWLLGSLIFGSLVYVIGMLSLLFKH
jgi:hypothetical protein